MRRSSVGPRGAGGPVLSPHEEVMMRSKRNSAPPAIRPGFMRRSCTFVTEGSWRKSSFGLGFTTAKDSKEKSNLALQVRKKAAELGTCEEEESSDTKPGKVSKLVGNLKSWSSSEDVRHSVVGAFARTVSVMKQKPTLKKVKQSVSNGPPGGTPGRFISRDTSLFNHHQNYINSTPLSNKERHSHVRSPREKLHSTPRMNGIASSNGIAPLNGFNHGCRSSSSPKLISPTSTPSSKGNLIKTTPKKVAENSRRLPVKVAQITSIPNKKDSAQRHGWLRHLHDAQSAYDAREGGRNRRNPHASMPAEAEDGQHENIRDVEEVDAESGESAEATGDRGKDLGDCASGLNLNNTTSASIASSASSNANSTSPDSTSKKTESGVGGSAGVGVGNSNSVSTPPSTQGPPTRTRRLQEVQIIQIVEGPSLIQPSEVTVSQGVVLSAEPVLTPIELLRRKDLKIRQELEEKQSLIADILNIPREDYESVADMAGEVGLANKEPRELVLGAIFQATKLQETLNEVQTVKDSDIIAAQASSSTDPSSRGAALSHSQKSVDKLLNISGTLAQLLNSLLSLVSERDDERDRMRKELVASRERLHHLHMKKNSLELESSADVSSAADVVNSTSNRVGTSTSPTNSRPNSYHSVGSSGLEQTEGETTHTDEDCKTEELANPSMIENKEDLENNKAEGEANIGATTDGSSCSPLPPDTSNPPLVPPQLDEGDTT